MTTTDPRRLAELFIKDRTGEKTKSTLYNNKGHLDQFSGWCDENNIESVRDLDGEALLEYKFYLKSDPDKNDATIRNHFSTLRTFFRFCSRLDATQQDQNLHVKLQAPDFSKGDLSRDDMMDFEEAKRLLDYLNKFEYATVNHVVFVILWHTGCRRGALRGLDLLDYEPLKQREHGQYALIRFQHRPETGTALKNKVGGEREVMVWPHYAEVIEDYINVNRRETTDESSRKPLITGPNGRYSANQFQSIIYSLTRPCYYSGDCPHDRDTETCEATYYNSASKCPSSVSTHPMRRTAITYHLEESDWTYEAASGRFNVSVDVLKEHYDESSTKGRRRTRAAHFFDGDQGVL